MPGAESDFEAAVLQKWELFLLHLSPEIKRLNIVFIGPELNSCYQSFKTSNIKFVVLFSFYKYI